MEFKDFLPIIIAVAVIAIVLYVVLLNRRMNNSTRKIAQKDVDDRRKSIKVSRVSGFIPYQCRAFFDALRAAMPDNYIVLPNIAVELLFRRINRKELELEGQYASFCVFNKGFVPVLVIQLNDYSVATDIVFQIPNSVKELIRSMGIPVMEYDIRDSYNIDELRRSIARAMNPLYTDK